MCARTHCRAEVSPGTNGCSYTQQCDAYWPGTTCTSGTCGCPTNYYAVTTRDGGACVTSLGTNNACPVPDLTTVAVDGGWCSLR